MTYNSLGVTLEMRKARFLKHVCRPGIGRQLLVSSFLRNLILKKNGMLVSSHPYTRTQIYIQTESLQINTSRENS